MLETDTINTENNYAKRIQSTKGSLISKVKLQLDHIHNNDSKMEATTSVATRSIWSMPMEDIANEI
jgi:hypothetical protein